MKKIIPSVFVFIILVAGNIIVAAQTDHEHVPGADMLGAIGYDTWFYAIGSVILVSLIAFVGLVTLSIKVERLKEVMLYLVSFAAGALFGDAFFHLMPEIITEYGFTPLIGSYIMSGIVVFFVLEKIIHWRHCHHPVTKDHPHPFTYMNLIGDGVHNFIDGLIIGISYIVSIPVGVATTIAVILHEIPQEIGDFGVLIHGGFTRKKALSMNFLTALTAVLGAIVSLAMAFMFENVNMILLPFAVGGFLYIAGSDLIPELHKETKLRKSFGQLVMFLVGILIMFALLGME